VAFRGTISVFFKNLPTIRYYITRITKWACEIRKRRLKWDISVQIRREDTSVLTSSVPACSPIKSAGCRNFTGHCPVPSPVTKILPVDQRHVEFFVHQPDKRIPFWILHPGNISFQEMRLSPPLHDRTY